MLNHAYVVQHDQLFTVRARHRDEVQNGLLLLLGRSCCPVCQSVAYYVLKCNEHNIQSKNLVCQIAFVEMAIKIPKSTRKRHVFKEQKSEIKKKIGMGLRL
jgi:uncharacterized membrane protein